MPLKIVSNIILNINSYIYLHYMNLHVLILLYVVNKKNQSISAAHH